MKGFFKFIESVLTLVNNEENKDSFTWFQTVWFKSVGSNLASDLEKLGFKKEALQ